MLAALAVARKSEGRPHPRPEPVLKRLHVLTKIALLAMMPNERRLEIKRIQMTRRSAHEQLNHPLRPRRMMQRATEHTIGLQRLSPQHRRQRQPAQAAARLPKKITPAQRRSASFSVER